MNRDEVIGEIQERYRLADHSLNELQRRRWAAMEAMKLGRGGIAIVSRALRISRNTIKKGILEVEAEGDSPDHTKLTRIRRPGGGRKPIQGSVELSSIDQPDANQSQPSAESFAALEPDHP